MKFKNWCLQIAQVVGFWLLDQLKKMWENCLKEYLHNQIQEHVHAAVEAINQIHESEAYEAKKKEIIDGIFGKVKLPVILKPFGWLIKKILYNFVEEKVQAALEKLNTLA